MNLNATIIRRARGRSAVSPPPAPSGPWACLMRLRAQRVGIQKREERYKIKRVRAARARRPRGEPAGRGGRSGSGSEWGNGVRARRAPAAQWRPERRSAGRRTETDNPVSRRVPRPPVGGRLPPVGRPSPTAPPRPPPPLPLTVA